MMEAPNHNDSRVLHDAQINRALGAFLVFFGLVVLISILFTETGIGKLTNLSAGAVISGIGAAMAGRLLYWYLEAMKKYAVFSGRARRKEYWAFFLFNQIIGFVLCFIEVLAGGPGILASIYNLAVLIPGIAVSVRRLHDTDHSGWWLLIGFIPLIGALVLLAFLVQDGKPGDNRFGANPKSVAA